MDIDEENLRRVNDWIETHTEDDIDYDYYLRMKLALIRVLEIGSRGSQSAERSG